MLKTKESVSAKKRAPKPQALDERTKPELKLPDLSKLDLADLTDEQLLLQYRATGRREYFEPLVQRYEREMYNYLRRYLGSSEMAEDAFQATFLQLHMKCDQFDESRRVRPWLYAIAVNQAIDAQRRLRRHRMVSLDRVRGKDHSPHSDNSKFIDSMVSEEPSPWLEASAAERSDMMLAALSQLSDEMRMAVELVYYQGMKYREAASVLGIPVGTAKSRVHAAVVKLTEIWNLHPADMD